MAKLIRGGKLVPDNWRRLEAPEGAAAPEVSARASGEAREGGIHAPLPAGVIVPLASWPGLRDRALAGDRAIGVWLGGMDDPAVLVPDLDRLGLIAVRFPRFNDGRGYSIARLLRGRYGWRGELRAFGDVLRDQLFYLARCGFDAFELREDQDVDAALAAFADFSEVYQVSADQPLPLFRRRVA